MDEGGGHVAHLEQALVGHLLVDQVNYGQQVQPMLLHPDRELVQGQDDPLQLLLTDGVGEQAQLGSPLQQVQAAELGQLVLLHPAVAGLGCWYMNRAW